MLEILFIGIRENENIKGIKIFDDIYKLSAYADDTTFFLNDEKSVENLIKSFDMFSKYSGLKLNSSKCEICGIGAKRGEYVALCGMKSIDLVSESIKILGIHYSYNERVRNENNYLQIMQTMDTIVKVWKMRNLTLLGKVTILKTLIFSKIVFLSFLTSVPTIIIEHLEEMQKDFLWDGKRAKISHKTLVGPYEEGGLKSVDIKSKIESLQLSWIKRLYDKNDHPWKKIPKTFFKKAFIATQFFSELGA